MKPSIFTARVLQYFGFLREQHNFWGLDESYPANSSGSGRVRMESDRYVLEFILEGKGSEVTLTAARIGHPPVDLAWVFAYLTRGLVSGATGSAPWLYYFPLFTLGLRGEESINWQLGRLSKILCPMWPAIFIFLDMDGTRGADFQAFVERAKRSAAERAEDGYRRPLEMLSKRAPLCFIEHADKSFAFLKAYGFKRVHADPIFVRYEKLLGVDPREVETLPARPGIPGPGAFAAGATAIPASTAVPTTPTGSRSGIYLNIFHRLHSFTLDLHVGQKRIDPSFELNFDLNELAGWMGATQQPVIAHSSQELQSGLNRLARQFRKYAAPILAGDARLLEALHTRRIDAARKASRAWEERNRR